MNEPLHLTASQKKAAERLDIFWRIKRSGSNRIGSTETRPIPLLVGPSGSGKTASVRDFAMRHGLPLFSISAGVWIVRGAKNDVLTTDAMAAWITEIIGELQALFVRYNAGAALSAKAVFKPTKEFHTARHRKILNWEC